MRYRLRTLLIFVALAAIVLALARLAINNFGPVAIGRSVEGRATLRQLADEPRVSLELFVESLQTSKDCELTPELRDKLVTWLQQAYRDTDPKKRIVRGHIRLHSGGDRAWIVLKISPKEFSVQTSDGTWRGLNPRELEQIFQLCNATE